MTSPIDATGYTPYASAYTPTAATTAVTQSSTGASSTSSSTDSLLDPQAFLQLLVAQLQYQDPTSPADMSSFMQQTATLTETQSITSMQQTLQTMLSTEQAQTATNMIGKTVTYTDASGATATGVVTGATSLTTGAQVTIGNMTVPLSSITGVNAQAANT